MTAETLADRIADLIARDLEVVARRLRVERHELPDGRRLPSLEVRSRTSGARVVVHVEPAL